VEETQEALKNQAAKHEEEKAAWEKEREEWAAERKRLGFWKFRCLDSKKKMNERIKDLEEDNKELRRNMSTSRVNSKI